MGELTLDTYVGPATFTITFLVLDISASFSLPLSIPWIHSIRAIPSSLHHKVRFIHDGQVITVTVDGGVGLPPKPILEISPAWEEQQLLRFPFDEIYTLDIANGSIFYAPLDMTDVFRVMPYAIMWSMGYIPGLGLRHYLQGMAQIVKILIDHPVSFGLGYQPTPEDWRVSVL